MNLDNDSVKIRYFRSLPSPITLMVLLVLSIIIHASMSVLDGPWFAPKLMIGLFGLILLPGFIFTNIVLDEENVKIVSSLILGFMLQLLNVYVIWILYIFYNPVNFALLMYTLTIIEVVLVSVLSYMRGLMLSIDKILNKPKQDFALVAVIVLYLVLAFYWQQWAPAPHSDGAAYLDMARNVVNNGAFYSNMLLPKNTWDYVGCSSGMLTHMFGYFAIALFFMLGDVSLFSAKIMLIFAGMLIIILLYALTRKLFNINVARLTALITAVSPLLLTHVGLVGGPEIPSALFILFSIYLLVCAPTSKRKMSMALMAGLSLFIAWCAWEFNFLVMLTFLPLLFIYTATYHKEFKTIDLMMLLFLLVSFILEWRVLLNFSYAVIGINIPSLIIVVFILTYLLVFRKEKNRNTLITFTLMFLVLYLILYSRFVAADFIPEVHQFVSFAQPGMGVLTSNIARDVGVLSRALSPGEVNRYWSTYWDGVYGYLGVVVVFLAFLSLARINKLKEVLLVLSFPLLQSVWWGLFVTIDGFQPRFILCSSLFYFVLAASAIEMVYSHAFTTLNMANKLRVSLKVKIGKIAHIINTKSLAAAFVTVLLLASFFNFTYPIYDKHKKVMEGWNYPYNLDWLNAFEWIQNNTSSEDVIAARYSYFAWYTNRRTVILSPAVYPNLNLTGLVNIIRDFKVSYLIVDQSLAWQQNALDLLYRSPAPFLGSKVVWNGIGLHGYKTVIYDVRNIAYGNLVKHETLVTNCDSKQYWSIFALYGNGTINTDDSDKVEGVSSIKIAFTVKEQKDLTPHAAVSFNPPEPLNLSNASFLQFWIKAPFSYQGILVKLATDPNNYIMLYAEEVPTQAWRQVTIPLTNIAAVLGTPNLHSIDFIQIYIKGLEPTTTYTFWLDDISAYTELYIINE